MGDKIHVELVLTKEHAADIVAKLRSPAPETFRSDIMRQRWMERIADTIERQVAAQ